MFKEKLSNHHEDFFPGEKSLKAPFAIYLDLECLLKKEQYRENNNLEKSHTVKKKQNTSLLLGQCLKNEKKINLIIAEEKIVLKNYVKS